MGLKSKEFGGNAKVDRVRTASRGLPRLQKEPVLPARRERSFTRAATAAVAGYLAELSTNDTVAVESLPEPTVPSATTESAVLPAETER